MDEAFEEAPEILDALGLIQSEEEIAYILVISSFLDAIAKLVHNEGIVEENYDKSIEVIDFYINEKLEKQELILDSKLLNAKDFFQSILLGELKDILKKYLENLQIEGNAINNLLERFSSYFLFSLNRNWLIDSRYALLLNILEKDTPFKNLSQKILKWNEYYSYLNEQIDLPLFSENFSLRQIYIPLRALTNKPITYKGEENNKSKIIVELEKEVLEWISQEDMRDTIRLISGGPGSGKSSFLKIISTKIALESSIKVIFIPLHLISFNKSLDDSINTYLSTIAGISFTELFEFDEKIILIFDGLDELASQGEVGESVARDFSNELQRTLRLHNSQKVKIKAIVSGRDIVIQNEKKYLKVNSYELLPYFMEDLNEKMDPFELRFVDQRDIWWNKYANLKNINVSNILEQIKSENLQEITSQPLLNYLVAILLEVGEVELSEQTTINQIYEHLLKEVYRRGWEHHETYGPIQSIRYEEFLMILQEISYTA